MKTLVFSFIVWRLGLFFVVIAGTYLLSYRPNQEFTGILSKIPPQSIVNSSFLYPWANFDGVHYLSIAGNGYSTEARFFPFYPLLITFISSIMGSSTAFSDPQFFAGFFISNISLLAGLIFFYKLLRFDYSDEIAKISILFLLVFPTSFFFGAIYSESVFFVLLMVAFYFARKRNWFFAGVAGLLLSGTRPVGVLILPALLYELILSGKMILPIKERYINTNFVKNFLCLLLIPLGIIGYALFNKIKWGSYLFFLTAQGDLGNSRSTEGIILPPQTLVRYLKILTTLPTNQFEWWISLLEVTVFVFVFVLVLIYWCWKKNIRKSYLIFSILAFLTPVLSGTFSGLPRYALILFPIYIVLGMIKNNFIKRSYLIISCILLFVLLLFFSRGYYIS